MQGARCKNLDEIGKGGTTVYDERLAYFLREFDLLCKNLALRGPHACTLYFVPCTSIKIQSALPNRHDLRLSCEFGEFSIIKLLLALLPQLHRIVMGVGRKVIRVEANRRPYAIGVSRGKRDGVGRGLKLRADVHYADTSLACLYDNFVPILVVGRELHMGVGVDELKIRHWIGLQPREEIRALGDMQNRILKTDLRLNPIGGSRQKRADEVGHG